MCCPSDRSATQKCTKFSDFCTKFSDFCTKNSNHYNSNRIPGGLRPPGPTLGDKIFFATLKIFYPFEERFEISF